MIDYVCGKIGNIAEKSVTIDINGFGLTFQVPDSNRLIKNKEITLHTYMHWTQDNGPALYGFTNQLDRKVFLLLIDCPKIGPSIALNMLSQASAGQLLEMLSTQNERRLSSLNGIGAKKAEQLIVQLKHKVQKLLTSGEVAVETQGNFVQWQQVNDVLVSLNYSKPEIAQVMSHLSSKFKNDNSSLDQLIRSALSFLSRARG